MTRCDTRVRESAAFGMRLNQSEQRQSEGSWSQHLRSKPPSDGGGGRKALQHQSLEEPHKPPPSSPSRILEYCGNNEQHHYCGDRYYNVLHERVRITFLPPKKHSVIC